MIPRQGRWSLRIMAVATALLLWSVVKMDSLGNDQERVVEASVTYDAPSGLIILNPVEKVRVRLRGPESAVQHVNPFQINVKAILPKAEVGPINVPLGPDNVLTPEDLEVVSVEPNYLRLEMDREVKRLLPVEPAFVGEPAAGAIAAQSRVSPSSILVSGPESLLRLVESLSTSPVSLDGHALDFEESALVISPDPLISFLQPSVVSVHVSMVQPDIAGDGDTER